MWVADIYSYQNNILDIKAQINPGAATQHGLTLCLWTGGAGNNSKILDCLPVIRP